MGNVIAGFILSLLMVAGALFAFGIIVREFNLAAGRPFKEELWIGTGLFSLIGVGLMVGAVFLTNYSMRLISHRVEICANGFRYCWHRSAEDVLWVNISRIRETLLHERPPLLKGPAKLLLPKVTSTSYTVITTAGKEYRFDGNSIKSIKQFGKVLREQAERMPLPWEKVDEQSY